MPQFSYRCASCGFGWFSHFNLRTCPRCTSIALAVELVSTQRGNGY